MLSALMSCCGSEGVKRPSSPRVRSTYQISNWASTTHRKASLDASGDQAGGRHGGRAERLRRQSQLREPELRRPVRGLVDGEELDLDAAIDDDVKAVFDDWSTFSSENAQAPVRERGAEIEAPARDPVGIRQRLGDILLEFVRGRLQRGASQ